MNILVANNHLEVTGGSENFTYALATELIRQGHTVHYYCDPLRRGEFAMRMERELGVKYKKRRLYDLVLANHTTMVSALAKVGVIIQTCHGVFPDMEQPAVGAHAYVAISWEVQQHILSLGYDSTLILNGIDCTRFSPSTPLNTSIKSVLSLCQGDEANNMVREVCEELGVDYKHASKTTNNVFAIEELINESDMVIGIGRSLYDAMACGRVCVSLDSRSYSTAIGGCSIGGDGYITTANIAQNIKHNLTGRGSGISMSKELLKQEMLKYKPQDGVNLRAYALEHLNMEINVKRYLKIYTSLGIKKPNILKKLLVMLNLR